MKKRQSKRVFIFIVVSLGVLGAGGLGYHRFQQQIPKGESAPLSRVNQQQKEIETAIQLQDWAKVRGYLEDVKSSEITLIQILRYTEMAPDLSALSGPIFATVMGYVDATAVTARNRVLAFRIFSHLNLSADQQKALESYFEKDLNKRFKKDLYGHALVGIVPFPESLRKNIVKGVQKDLYSAVESLFLVSSLKDAQAKERIHQELLNRFTKLKKDIKPHVAKHLLYHSSDSLQKEPAYSKMKKYVAAQKDPLYRELQQVYGEN